MEILNIISYGSATFLMGLVLLFDFSVIVTSIYSLFTKKIKGGLFAKLLIVFVSLGVFPWILKIMFYFLTKIGL